MIGFTLRSHLRGLLPLLTAALLLAACGGGTTASKIPGAAGDAQDLRPYIAAGPYAEVLRRCAIAESASQSCSLRELPLIGMETEAPTVADIMERVVVSHDWMGERFEQALERLPDDIRLLLRAVAVIVIDADIRPAYYTTASAGIYLDPASLWITPDELATISREPDYRSGFSDPLNFRSLGRFIKDGDYIYPHGALEANPDKTLDDVVLMMAPLLYHELAHANDFLPPDTWDYLDRDQSVYRAAAENAEDYVARHLYDAYPLTSTTLHELADVMYRGETPTQSQRAITAGKVGQLFEDDGASDHYAYNSVYEDTAMLFEEVMLKYHYDIDRDVAFTDAPDEAGYCDSYVVRWGVRNRIGDSYVKTRAHLVTSRILPSADMNLFYQELPAPQYMPAGQNWCEVIDMGEASKLGIQKVERRLLPRGDLEVRYR